MSDLSPFLFVKQISQTAASEFDRPLLYRLSYEARREQVMAGDYGGNHANVNVEGAV